jgi:tetratricopeptide (TPR) repeat protein
MDPNRNYFYYNRGLTAKAMGNNAQAATDFKKSLDLKTTAEAYYQLGLLAYQRKDMAEAKTEFENARMLRSDMTDMNFFLGLIYFKDKQYEEGYKCFQSCTDNNKNNAEAYYYRGFCAAELGMRDEAVQSLKYAIVYNGKEYRYFLKMFEVYKTLGDNQNALNNITMVIELGERKPENYLKRAELYKLTGQDFLAEEDNKTAAQLSTSAAVEEDK